MHSLGKFIGTLEGLETLEFNQFCDKFLYFILTQIFRHRQNFFLFQEESTKWESICQQKETYMNFGNVSNLGFQAHFPFWCGWPHWGWAFAIWFGLSPKEKSADCMFNDDHNWVSFWAFPMRMCDTGVAIFAKKEDMWRLCWFRIFCRRKTYQLAFLRSYVFSDEKLLLVWDEELHPLAQQRSGLLFFPCAAGDCLRGRN